MFDRPTSLAMFNDAIDPIAFELAAATYIPNTSTVEENENTVAELRNEIRLRRAYELRDLKFEALTLNRPIPFESASKYLSLTDKHSLLATVLELRPFMERTEWLTMLGENWMYYFCIGRYLNELRAALPTSGPVPELMSEGGGELFATLPDVVRVYRGCGSDEPLGICWSLNRNVAYSFRNFPGYGPIGYEVLQTAVIEKNQILGIRLERHESEIITFGAKVESIQVLAPPGWRANPLRHLACARL